LGGFTVSSATGNTAMAEYICLLNKVPPNSLFFRSLAWVEYWDFLKMLFVFLFFYCKVKTFFLF
jgi:hypothetical protein